ncbi:hypothetical protein AB0X56_04790 [Weissella paramesenteroides]|uniref:hypothetical protein n=1 Tax=Weissella paramesenteroides TaxID=1249 RepID=UPI00103A05EF|nr:hypothetical protein [Weissella paramesenteroides]RZQ57810.1 hypothetical protein EWR19_01535 [Weissella paramesenteroides]
MVFKKNSRVTNRQQRSKVVDNSKSVVEDDNREDSSVSPELLTREEHRITRHGRYELDAQTRKLTKNGKTSRLKHRLNVTIIVLIVLIIITYLILFFL